MRTPCGPGHLHASWNLLPSRRTDDRVREARPSKARAVASKVACPSARAALALGLAEPCIQLAHVAHRLDDVSVLLRVPQRALDGDALDDVVLPPPRLSRGWAFRHLLLLRLLRLRLPRLLSLLLRWDRRLRAEGPRILRSSRRRAAGVVRTLRPLEERHCVPSAGECHAEC